MTDTFANNDPGEQPIVRFMFEEWADPDDQHRAVVEEEHTTREGRLLRPGDLITPRQAREERVRHRLLAEHRLRDAGEFSRRSAG